MDMLHGDMMVGCGINAKLISGARQVPSVWGKALALDGYPQAASIDNIRDTCAAHVDLCD